MEVWLLFLLKENFLIQNKKIILVPRGGPVWHFERYLESLIDYSFSTYSLTQVPQNIIKNDSAYIVYFSYITVLLSKIISTDLLTLLKYYINININTYYFYHKESKESNYLSHALIHFLIK